MIHWIHNNNNNKNKNIISPIMEISEYGYSLPIKVLQTLREEGHADVMDYIKTYKCSSNYANADDPYLIAVDKKMKSILNQVTLVGHSGDSFNFTFQMVKAVLLGLYTDQDLAQAKIDEDERRAAFVYKQKQYAEKYYKHE